MNRLSTLPRGLFFLLCSLALLALMIHSCIAGT